MDEEDILNEAKQIDKELQDELPKKRSKWPFIIIGVLLAIIIALYVIPYHVIPLNPEPKNIPTRIQALAPGIESVLEPKKEINGIEDIRELINPADHYIKFTADRIASQSCREDVVCYAKAMYYFIRDNFQYIPDPVNQEYLEDPKEFLVAGGGDCESGSIALASLEEAVGVDAQLVLISNHMYIRISLPDAPSTYQNDGWIYLDWTCKECSFGEIPWQNWKEEKIKILEVP